MARCLWFFIFLIVAVLRVQGSEIPLNDYNLITIGDFKTDSEVEGRTFVGGDLIGPQSQNFGIMLSAPYNDPTLQVAGNIVSGNPINASGHITVSNQNSIWQRANQYKVNDRWVNNVSSITYDSNLPATQQALKQELETAAASFAQMAANSQVSRPTSCCGAYQFIVDENLAAGDYAVFDVRKWGIFVNSHVQQIEILANNLSSLAGVIINVGGLNVNWSNSANKVGKVLTSKLGRKKVLWNFHEATSINLHAKSFMGALLAPYATVRAGNPVEGSMGVYSLLTTSEVHLPLSSVQAPKSTVEVAEPSSILMFIFAVVLLFLVKKQPKTRASI